MNIDEKIQQVLNAPDDCGYARLAKDLARFLQESRVPTAAVSAVAPATAPATATATAPAVAPSRGRLEWLRGTVCWFLVPPGETDYWRACYGATYDLADSWKDGGVVQTRVVDCNNLDASVRQIVAWATADGYEVPPHPKGLGQ